MIAIVALHPATKLGVRRETVPLNVIFG